MTITQTYDHYVMFRTISGTGRGAVFSFRTAPETGQGHSHSGQHDGPDGEVGDGERQRRRVQQRAHHHVVVSGAQRTAAGHGRHNSVQQLQEQAGHVEP